MSIKILLRLLPTLQHLFRSREKFQKIIYKQ